MDRIQEIASRLKPGLDFTTNMSPDATTRIFKAKRDLVPVKVKFRDSVQDITIGDTGKRPPDPDGVWLDDLVSASCRVLFGCNSGTARKVQGTDLFEFREFWHDPTLYKVHADIFLTVIRGGVEVRKEKVHVRTSALPGAEEDSVILASCYLLCERRFGMGVAEWMSRSTSAIRYTIGVGASAGLIPCRYTIHAGKPTELTVYLPSKSVRQWEMVRLALSVECSKRFGRGTLKYMPEMGETHFSWK